MRKISIAALAGLAAAAALSAAPPALTTLYSFTNTGDGTYPGPPVIGPGGVLYGTTSSTVYSVTPPSQPGGSWTEQTLYTFQGGDTDGSGPSGKLVQSTGPQGQLLLYGVTEYGGPGNGGIVYSLTAPASPNGPWTEEVLYFFNVQNVRSNPDGQNPETILMGAGGVLYGITYAGGSVGCHEDYGCGTIFSLTPPAAPGGAWTESVLCSTEGNGTPNSFVMGADGVLYGTAQSNGILSTACDFGQSGPCGTVFSLAPPQSPGGDWTLTVIFSFDGATGFIPYSLAVGAEGVLYGSTFDNVYSLAPPELPGGAWTQTVLADFKVTRFSGASPIAITPGAGGVIYGATADGGQYQCGSLFALAPPTSPGAAWTLKTLISVNPADQGVQVTGFVIGAGPHPTWYGATGGGEIAVNQWGTIFEFQP